LFDGWSLPIVMEELLENYQKISQGQQVGKKQQDKFEDYIRYIESKDIQISENYWKEYLEPLEQNTLLPFIPLTKDRNKGIGEYSQTTLEINSTESSTIQNFCKQNRITVNTLMQGIWSFLLHNYTGNATVNYGVTVSGRPEDLAQVEQRVGMYINTIPLITQFDPNKTIVSWLKEIQDQQLSSREHQYTALQQIQQWSGIQGDMFDSILVFENYPVSKVIAQKQWKLQVEDLRVSEQTNYPLTLVIQSAEEIKISLGYNSQLLDEEQVVKIKDHFAQVLGEVIKHPEEQCSQINILSKDELNQLENFNSKPVNYPKDKTAIEIFEQQVRTTPDSVALKFKDTELSYKQLNERANQLAHYLLNKGVTPEMPIPICINRSVEMIVGILGILKSGAAYVPIDPQYPQQRIEFMLNDIGANIVVTDKSSEAKFNGGQTEIIDIETDWNKMDAMETSNPRRVNQSNHLAYIIYTSGSTGNPKGVMVEHQSLVNLILAQTDHFSIDANERILQFSNYSFDASVEQIFLALLNGAALVLFEESLLFENESLRAFIVKEKITHLHATPAFLRSLGKIENGELKRVIAGGDICDWELRNQWKGSYKFYNEYGPTETTVTAIEYLDSENLNHIKYSMPIGKPLANTKVYILNSNSKKVPVGVTGEIHISGIQVARGYINLPELTSEKFVEDPFSKKEKLRMYRTGDLGRWLADGNIEYLGRIDDQVKIRGFRIEPGEIENVIIQTGLVAKTVVVSNTDLNGDLRLIGYIEVKPGFKQNKLIDKLKQKLPNYMIPAIWIELDSMPLTSNGKIDKKALPLPDLEERFKDQYVAPSNETEQKLVEIWQNLLKLERIGIKDNFFETGGHSILAIRAVSAINKEFSINISVKAIFEFSNIEDLSNYISLLNSNIERGTESEVFEL